MNITTRISDKGWTLTNRWLKLGTRLYIAVSTFAEKDMAKGAGFRWNPDKRVWWTNDANNAAKLSEWADVTCKEELDQIRKRNFASTIASKATTTDRDIPHPEGLDYYPFQKAGVAFCLNVFGK